MKITEALVLEHRVLAGVFRAVERALSGVSTAAETRTLAVLLQSLLEDHADAETELAYLALDHVLHDRGQLDRMHQDHQEIDATLREAVAAGDCDRGKRLLAAAIAATREHMRLEEEKVFPLVERALHDETLTGLTVAWAERRALTSSAA